MTQEHPVVERYMTHFEHSIKQFDFPEQQEVARRNPQPHCGGMCCWEAT